MRKIIGLAGALVMAAFSVAGVTGATAANAGTGYACYETSCTGLDPTYSYNSHTGYECSSGAYDVLSHSELGGYLELRWGPDCGVNWARFTPGNNDEYQLIVEDMTNGPWVGSGVYNPDVFWNGAGVAHWTDQVYAGNDPAGACVTDLTTGSAPMCIYQ